MLLSSKGGLISCVTLVSETRHSWFLIDDQVQIKVSKRDNSLRVFKLMSEALIWTSADQELIQSFRDIEAKAKQKGHQKGLNS